MIQKETNLIVVITLVLNQSVPSISMVVQHVNLAQLVISFSVLSNPLCQTAK